MHKIYTFFATALIFPCLLQAQVIPSNQTNSNSPIADQYQRGPSGTMEQRFATWQPTDDNDWDNPANWVLGILPDENTIVDIPANYLSIYPYIYGNMREITIGGLIMEESEIDGDFFFLIITDTLHLEYAYLGAVAIFVQDANSPYIENCDFNNQDFYLRGITGDTHIFYNTFTGDVTIRDSSIRSGPIHTGGNIFYEELTYINNSNYGNNYLSSDISDPDIVHSNLIINNNSTGVISIGSGGGEPLQVYSNVTITETTDMTVDLSKITFKGATYPHLTVPGPYMVPSGPGFLTVPFTIDSLMFRKDGETSLILDQPITLKKYLLMSDGNAAIVSAVDKILQIADNCVVVDENLVDGSFIEGPISKIGDDPFTFPLGYITPPAGRNGNSYGMETGRGKLSHDGYFKAPLSMTAPANVTDEFVAEYKRNNPTDDGYDVSLTAPGAGTILAEEYWMLQRTSGSSNVSVSLTYDDLHITEPFDPAMLLVAGWDDTQSQWESRGNGGTTGNSTRGTVASAAPLTTYGPLALSLQGPLPVTWIYFKGINKGNANLLEWATAGESNTEEYLVERSADGQHFTAIGTVKAAGNTAQTSYYQYTDEAIDQLQNKAIYYRLAQVDMDGRVRYSNVIYLVYDAAVVSKTIVYPTLTEGIFSVKVGDASLIGTMATIVDEAGMVLMKVEITSGNQSFNLGGYTNGIYFIRLANREVFRIVKQ